MLVHKYIIPKRKGGPEKLLRNLERLGVEALIPIGGEDTLGVALRLSEQGVSLVGVPKTIDNDLYETDYTIGLNTATQAVSDALDSLHSTAEAHHRVMLVEVMGRDSGWIATLRGLAGGADLILIPLWSLRGRSPRIWSHPLYKRTMWTSSATSA